jgi:hypothetical protein
MNKKLYIKTENMFFFLLIKILFLARIIINLVFFFIFNKLIKIEHLLYLK